MSPSLVLGPILRGVSPNDTSVWVETSGPCQVTVRGRTVPTFQVAGHHYGLVDLGPLPPAATTSYTVELDGRQVWPDRTAGAGPSVIVTGDHRPMRIMAGSCRQQAPQPLWQRRRNAGFGELGPDALAVLAHELQQGRRPHPDLLILTGDQVYADEQHRSVRRALRRRRGRPSEDGFPEVTTYEEYTWLYQQTWSQPLIRWLLATVPSLMIFDDHDVIDDWNISDSWTEDMADRPWWDNRIRSALMSYWVYQHLGNLSPAQRAQDELYRTVIDADDGAEALAELATRLAAGSTDRLTQPWSYHHRTDRVDIVVLDTRNARVLEPAERSMLAPPDWARLERLVSGESRNRGADRTMADERGAGADRDVAADRDRSQRHLLIVSSVPWALPPGIHRLQQWVSHLADRVGDGPGSATVGAVGEWVRRAIDLEHWPAFGRSYQRLRDLLRDAGGRPVDAPPSTVVLSGDVHFAYIARVDLGPGVRPAHQVVASPLRQVEMGYERAARRLSMSAVGRLVLDGLARLSGAGTEPISFTLTDGPVFGNNIATLEYWPDRAEATLERAVVDGTGQPTLSTAGQQPL